MTPDHIDDYLRELAARLPLPGSRLLKETEEHLRDARDRLVSEGMDPIEAEARAIADLGAVSDLVAAVAENGGPSMSPRGMRIVSWLAFLLTIPTLIFISVNAIEQLAGNGGGIGVFQGTFDRYQDALNILLTAGPVMTFLLVFFSGVRFRLSRQDGGITGTIHIRLTGWVLAAAIVSALTAAALAIYLFTENVFCIEGISTFC